MRIEPKKVVLVYAVTCTHPETYELLAVCSDAAHAQELCERADGPTYSKPVLLDSVIPEVAAICLAKS